jgi:hypothetical protein
LPPPNPRDFYDLAAPRLFQQGDILPGVLLTSVLPSEHAVVVRHAETRGRLQDLGNGTPIALHHEQAINGAFDDGEPEHVLVSAQRGAAMIVTQTCDLVDNENWMICPVCQVEGSDVTEDTLFAEHPLRSYRTLFGVPAHPNGYFSVSYVNLADMRSIHRNSVTIDQRTASLSVMGQVSLGEKIAKMFGRAWGYREGEIVPKDGKYRCHLCNWFVDAENPERELKQGEVFPACEGCARRHKTAQWYQLQPNRKY